MNELNRSRPSWNADQTHPGLMGNVETALREVIDPEIGLNVIELGLIRNVEIQEEQAHITMMMTTPFCPYAPALLEMARKKVETTIDIPTTISMSMEPWDPSMMEEGVGADWGLF